MNHPPPHSFSRSPVEEVLCRCTCESGIEPLSLTIPPPYPGWPHIRDGIREMITGAGEISRITGCMLRYTDQIPVADGKILPGTETIVNLLSGEFDCSFDNTQNGIVLISTKFPNTAGSVSSVRNRAGKPGWILIFTMNTQGQARFDSSDDVLNWFDNARSAIHEIFDRIVPDEIVDTFR